MASNIVAEWLRSLHLGQYADSFIDNGYDDLEICKQVGDPDLDAIGVFNPVHRNRLLQSVRTLREEGAASVYFSLEESAAVHEECLCDNLSARSSRTSSGRSDKETAAVRVQTSPAASSSAESGQEVAKYLDEYEEGKAELVRIPRMQLKMLLREKVAQDGIRLTCQPYSTPVSSVTCSLSRFDRCTSLHARPCTKLNTLLARNCARIRYSVRYSVFTYANLHFTILPCDQNGHKYTVASCKAAFPQVLSTSDT